MSYQQRVSLGKDVRGLPLRAYTIVNGRRIVVGMDIIDAKKGDVVLTFQTTGKHNYKIEGINTGKVYKSSISTVTTQSTPVTEIVVTPVQPIVEGIMVTIGIEPVAPRVGDYWGVPV